MYQVKDIVELGHMNETGGSVKIALKFNDIVNPEPYLELIDSLDHTIITDNTKVTTMSDRYFLLSESRSLLRDVVTVMSNLIMEYERTLDAKDLIPCIECTVELGKLQFSSELIEFSKLVSMSVEG